MLDRQYNGVIVEDKWGKTYLCSACLFAYSDLGPDYLGFEVTDQFYGRYFLQDLEPAWNHRDIWLSLYRAARPWQTDFTKLNTLQLRDELIKLFDADEMRIWQLTDGWGTPPTDNGIGEGGLSAAGSSSNSASSSSSTAPAAKTAKPKGGSTAEPAAPAATAKAHEAKAFKGNNKDSSIPTDEEIALARSENDSPVHTEAREKVAKHFLVSNGFSESQIANAIGDKEAGIEGGVDLTKPVEILSFPPPEEMTQYVKSHGFPGNWFDPLSNQSPDMLGLSGEGRSLVSFKMPKSKGLLSCSKPIVDNWTNPLNPVSTSGGG